MYRKFSDEFWEDMLWDGERHPKKSKIFMFKEWKKQKKCFVINSYSVKPVYCTLKDNSDENFEGYRAVCEDEKEYY